MRIAISIIVLLFAIAKCYANIEWLETKHDFGEVMESEGKVNHLFLLVNNGSEDVVINHVRASCGCSYAEYPRYPIAPGDTAAIVATFDPVGRPGIFNMFFTVLTNTDPHRSTLELRGKVIANGLTVNEKYPVEVGSLKLNAGSVPFGEVVEGGMQTATIEAYNDSDTPMKFYVSDVPEYITVAPYQALVAPYNLYVITVGLNTDSCRQRGYVENHFNLFAEPQVRGNGVMAGIKRVDVMAVIYDDFASWSDEQHENAPIMALDVDRLSFIDVDSLSSEPVTRQFTITNNGNDRLKIYGIHATDRCVEVGSFKEDLGKGETMVVKISVIPDKIGEKILNTNIIIYCNDPRRPKSLLRIVGNKN